MDVTKKDVREAYQYFGQFYTVKGRVAYTPVNYNPMPFSVEINLNSMRIEKRIIGVIPNSTYRGHIYSWEELCELINQEKEDN